VSANETFVPALRSTPLRRVRFGQADIAVLEREHRAAAVTVRAALWMVQHWGIVSVTAVAERARALAPGFGVDALVVSRVLGAAPSTRWLDGPDRRWFSLTAPTSQVEMTVRKALAVATSVRIEELREGLIKAVPAVADAPYSVLEQFLRQIVNCAIEGAIVRLADDSSIADASLSPAEAGLIAILLDAGGVVELSALRRRALAASLPEATTRRLLKMSPLFLHQQDGAIRLIGRDSGLRLMRAIAYRVSPQPTHP
jgi:hypothetical protein